MGTVRWRYTSIVPPPLFVDAMQEVLDRRGWRALADAEVVTRYLDQLREKNVEQPWDEWDAQWEQYDEGAGDDQLQSKAAGEAQTKTSQSAIGKGEAPQICARPLCHPWSRMLTAQHKADLDKQIARTHKDMAKAQARLSELRPKVRKANSLSRAAKGWAPNDKKIRKIRKVPLALKPLEKSEGYHGYNPGAEHTACIYSGTVGRWGGQLTTCSFWMWLELRPLCRIVP